MQLFAGIVAFSLICFILYGINLNMATFLIAVGQDPEISVRVGRYLVWFMPAVPVRRIALTLATDEVSFFRHYSFSKWLAIMVWCM
jgi:hypothetical protein